MKISTSLLTMSAAAVLLGACAHDENYRWSSASHPTMPDPVAKPDGSTFEWRGPSVSVYSYATPPTAKPSVTIKDLSDRGQAAYIAQLGATGADPKKLGTTLSKPLGASDSDVEGAATVDESFNRTLVATVAEGLDAGPADRLVWTWIDIHPRNFLFDGYTIAATDNETLNIESIQNQSNASLQAQIGDTASNTNGNTTTTAPAANTAGTTIANALTKVLGTSAGATASLSNQYTTSATINQQYEKLHVDIIPGELRIFRASERNLDVTGNTLIALTMRVDPDRFRVKEVDVQRVAKLSLSKDGAQLPPDKVDIGVTLEKSPPHCPLLADVTLIYELRKVADARSYVEGQQKPEYFQNLKTSHGVQLVPADAVRQPSWRVYGAGDATLEHVVLMSDVFRQTLPLDFSTYEQARDFAAWMNQNAAWIATDPRRRLGKDGYALATLDPAIPFPGPPYRAQRFQDPDEASQCQAMSTLTQPQEH